MTHFLAVEENKEKILILSKQINFVHKGFLSSSQLKFQWLYQQVECKNQHSKMPVILRNSVSSIAPRHNVHTSN